VGEEKKEIGQQGPEEANSEARRRTGSHSNGKRRHVEMVARRSVEKADRKKGKDSGQPSSKGGCANVKIGR